MPGNQGNARDREKQGRNGGIRKKHLPDAARKVEDFKAVAAESKSLEAVELGTAGLETAGLGTAELETAGLKSVELGKAKLGTAKLGTAELGRLELEREECVMSWRYWSIGGAGMHRMNRL